VEFRHQSFLVYHLVVIRIVGMTRTLFLKSSIREIQVSTISLQKDHKVEGSYDSTVSTSESTSLSSPPLC